MKRRPREVHQAFVIALTGAARLKSENLRDGAFTAHRASIVSALTVSRSAMPRMPIKCGDRSKATPLPPRSRALGTLTGVLIAARVSAARLAGRVPVQKPEHVQGEYCGPSAACNHGFGVPPSRHPRRISPARRNSPTKPCPEPRAGQGFPLPGRRPTLELRSRTASKALPPDEKDTQDK